MSYDVSIGTESFDYTSNLGPFFHAVLDRQCDVSCCWWKGFDAINGLKGSEAAEVLVAAFDNIRAERRKEEGTSSRTIDEALEARLGDPGGWGSVLGATLMLQQLLEACRRFPDQVVEVWQ